MRRWHVRDGGLPPVGAQVAGGAVPGRTGSLPFGLTTVDRVAGREVAMTNVAPSGEKPKARISSLSLTCSG